MLCLLTCLAPSGMPQMPAEQAEALQAELIEAVVPYLHPEDREVLTMLPELADPGAHNRAHARVVWLVQRYGLSLDPAGHWIMSRPWPSLATYAE